MQIHVVLTMKNQPGHTWHFALVENGAILEAPGLPSEMAADALTGMLERDALEVTVALVDAE